MIVFKNNYVENEKLFSTGDSELDDILEEVYYSGIEDGYDYAQKEFSKKSKAASMALREAAGLSSSRSSRIARKQHAKELYNTVNRLSKEEQLRWWEDLSRHEREKFREGMRGTTKDALDRRISAKGNHWTARISKRKNI